METRKLAVSFKTSADADDKKAGDSINTETTILFKDWTDADFEVASARTVIIGQIQPKLRKGDRIGKEFIASRPGTRGVVKVTPWDALVEIFKGDKVAAAACSDKFDGAEQAMEKLRIFLTPEFEG